MQHPGKIVPKFAGVAHARMVNRTLVAIVIWNPVCRLLRLLRNRDTASTSAGQQWQIEITV